MLFRSDGNQMCYLPSQEYPIATWMIKPMNELILKGELKFEILMKMDTENDASGVIK